MAHDEERRLQEKIAELYQTTWYMGWISLAIAFVAAIVALGGGITGQLEIAAIAAFLSVMFGLMALGNFAMRLHMRPHQPKRTKSPKPDSKAGC